MVGSQQIGVVFVHGFLSKGKTWRHFTKRLAEDGELSFVEPMLFEYSSPLMSFNPLRRVPSYDDIADTLKVYLKTRPKTIRDFVLVTHSQGGLIVQRYLHRMLSAGHGTELEHIRRIIMYACPHSGAQLADSLPLLKRNVQRQQLRTLTEAVMDAQQTVIARVDHATEVRAETCPIPITAYAGDSDNIVPRGAGQGVFRNRGSLPGDHFSIIRPGSLEHLSYRVLRDELVAVRSEAVRREPQNPAPSMIPNERLTGWSRHVLLAREELIHVDDVMARLTDAIRSSASTAAVAVWGGGGLGKTAITYAAAERVARTGDFTHIVWASARNTHFYAEDASSTAVNSIYWHDLLAMIAEQLGCDLPDSQALWEPEIADHLRRRLSDAKILVVVDNLEIVAAADQVIDKLRSLGMGAPHKIVATTRWGSERNELDVRNISITPLSESHTYDLVRLAARDSSSDLSMARDSDLKAIYRITEGNPFLIKVIVSRYVLSGKPLARIINELTSVSEGGGLGNRVRTWLFDRSLDELAAQSTQEEALSLLFSFCANGRGGAMPYEDLRAESKAPSQQAFDRLLETACRLNLVRASDRNQRYSIHSLLYEHTCPLARARKE
ncbi:alpha/beta fold hydrolase [Streptomyces sp. NPDC059010]|uniref:esterase/lipase family protein n=1 Tax=Streptomyces sp. NPDC059010 TaxID=3346695 RepID=UPI00368DA280